VSSIGVHPIGDPNCILIEDAQVTSSREDANNNNLNGKLPISIKG
jgi:hypothetical protein